LADMGGMGGRGEFNQGERRGVTDQSFRIGKRRSKARKEMREKYGLKQREIVVATSLG